MNSGLVGKVRVALVIGLVWISIGSYAQVGFPYCETFQTPGTQAKTIFGGDARLTEGVLRLTSNQLNQRGYVYIDVAFPSTYGIKAEFEYFSYGGLGQFLADGISVFLFDADTPNFSAGGFGGSLGYAQRSNEPGLTNAYLGIGLDEFGNFGNSSEGRVGGFPGFNPAVQIPDAIVLRGPGNGFNGYPYVVGRRTMVTGNDGLNPGNQFPISSGGSSTSRVTDPNQVGYRKVFLELEPDGDGVGYFLTLYLIVTTQPNSPRRVTIFDRPYDFPAPKNLKIGFAASTGGFTNFHEIRNLVVTVSANDALKDPEGVDFEEIATCAGQANQFFITDEEVVLPNENSVIRCLQFYESLEAIDSESGDLCSQARCKEENRVLIVPQGIFQASDQAGGFTFFPNEEFIDQDVTVYYTITDSYGKTSKGNAMTLKIQESPEPIRLSFVGEDPETEEIDICKDQLVSMGGKGNEVYSRYEWKKDGELIEGATSATYSTSEEGEYEIIGYNRKNCPAISNKIVIDIPDFPSLLVKSQVVGCTPGQTVNVAAEIEGYDTVRYDYKMTGMGLSFLNNQLTKVGKSGNYQLQVKLKSLSCYSDPVPVEVFIQQTELTADFEFEVQGTGITGDSDGGIFPDDVIQFTDKSDSRAVKWDWDFGDGEKSFEENPVHVFGKKGQFEVKLTITDAYGCQKTTSKTVSITLSYRLMVPTGFTPNETENNTFLPKYKGLVSIEFMVFNSWGELIFKTNDLKTPGWDGTLKGKLLDAGGYVFRFDGVATDGEKVSESGKFRLIR